MTPKEQEARALAGYNQNSETFRSLNQLMWQIPLIGMTLTGGLWFGVSKVDAQPFFQLALLLLASVGNLGLIVVLARLRFIMGEYLEWLHAFEPNAFVEARGKGLLAPNAVRTTFQIMLGLAAVLSGALMVATAKQLDWKVGQSASARSSAFYDRFAKDLADSYESVPFEAAHPYLLQRYAAGPPLRVLDVGAGTGRDASWLAGRGHLVTAVEPSDRLRHLARQLHPDAQVRWVRDQLPGLKTQNPDRERFDLILLSAVWMHVRPDERSGAIERLAALLTADGAIYMTLRSGPSEPERAMYDVSVPELAALGRQNGLALVELGERPDLLGRSGVTWRAVTLVRRSAGPSKSEVRVDLK